MFNILLGLVTMTYLSYATSLFVYFFSNLFSTFVYVCTRSVIKGLGGVGIFISMSS